MPVTTPARNAALALLFAASALGQTQRASPASIRVHDFTLDSFTTDASNTLAKKYHVVIGEYGALADSETFHAFRVSIKRGTLDLTSDS